MISVPEAGLVTDDLPLRLVLEAQDDLLRKTIRIGRQWIVQNYPHHLPMSGERGLRHRLLDHESVRRFRWIVGWNTFYLDYVSKAESLQVRGVEAADGAGRVRQGIRALITEVGGVRGVSRSEAIEHYYYRAASHPVPFFTSAPGSS